MWSTNLLFQRLAVAIVCLFLFVPAGCLKPAGSRFPGMPNVQQGALHVIFFDLGQADATLIRYRDKSLLVDCGASVRHPGRASQRIPRRLDALLGTRHIDYFLATHYHADHVGSPGRTGSLDGSTGVYSLIERDGLTIGTVLHRGAWTADGKAGHSQRGFEKAMQRWLDNGVARRQRSLRVGDTIDMGDGLRVSVVASSGNGYLDRLAANYPTAVSEAPPSENDYSIALVVALGDFELFLGGDLSGQNVVRTFGPHSMTYNDIESQIAQRVGSVEVYKVNHHGSSSSSNPCFVEVLHPIVSIISSGKNFFGHPDPSVYERLSALSDVYITGGIDPELPSAMNAHVVGDDVELYVTADGERFWVDGQSYDSQSDIEEAKQPGWRPTCIIREGEVASPDVYDEVRAPAGSD